MNANRNPFQRPDQVNARRMGTGMKRSVVLGAWMLMTLSPGLAVATDAPTVASALAVTQADIAVAMEALAALRDRVDRDRFPLQAEHREMTDAVRAKRERLQRLQDARRFGDEQYQRIEREVARLEDEVQFVLTALAEYRRGLETRVSAAELQALRPALEHMEATLAAAGSHPAAIGEATEAVLDGAFDWNRRRVGGHAFEGAVLDGAGAEREGRFLALGPLAWFTDGRGDGALVTGTPGSMMPSMFTGHRERERRAISALIEGMPVLVPLDVSGGAALKRERATRGLVAQIREGGFVMVPLLLVGVLSILISVWKIVRLHRLREASTASLAGVIEQVQTGAFEAARHTARHLHPPLSDLIGAALDHRSAVRESLEEILHERILSMTPKWESHLGTLAVFGGVAPLLGLLGTVTGMIHTFELVTLFGTGEARLLSGGISEALITTKFGLAIAIPVLVVHAFLVRRVRAIVGTLEGAVVRFVNVLSGERPG